MAGGGWVVKAGRASGGRGPGGGGPANCRSPLAYAYAIEPPPPSHSCSTPPTGGDDVAVGEDEASRFIHNKASGIGTAGGLCVKGARLRHLEHHDSPHHSLQRLAPGVARHLQAGGGGGRGGERSKSGAACAVSERVGVKTGGGGWWRRWRAGGTGRTASAGKRPSAIHGSPHRPPHTSPPGRQSRLGLPGRHRALSRLCSPAEVNPPLPQTSSIVNSRFKREKRWERSSDHRLEHFERAVVSSQHGKKHVDISSWQSLAHNLAPLLSENRVPRATAVSPALPLPHDRRFSCPLPALRVHRVLAPRLASNWDAAAAVGCSVHVDSGGGSGSGGGRQGGTHRHKHAAQAAGRAAASQPEHSERFSQACGALGQPGRRP